MTGNEPTERLASDASRRMPGVYRNFLRPRRPSAIFAADCESVGSSASPDRVDAAAHDLDGEPA